MECNCKTNLEHELLDKIQNQHLEWSDPEVELGGYALSFGDNGVALRNTVQANVTYTHKFKNGNTKKKTTTMSIATAFCPHCGKKVAN